MAALAAGTAYAAEWKLLHNVDADGRFPPAKVEFDASSAKKVGAEVTFWKRTTFDQPVYLDAKMHSVSVVKQQTVFNCNARTSQVLARIFHDREGKTLHSTFAAGAVVPIAPDTIGEEELERLCAVKKRS